MKTGKREVREMVGNQISRQEELEKLNLFILASKG